MRSHLPISFIAVATLAALFAHIPAATAQARGVSMPGLNTIKPAPPEANITNAVIVIIPVAFTPLTTITFGNVGDISRFGDVYYAPVVLGWRSGRWEAAAQPASGALVPTNPLMQSGLAVQTIYVTGNCGPGPREQAAQRACTSSGANVIWSATIRF